MLRRAGWVSLVALWMIAVAGPAGAQNRGMPEGSISTVQGPNVGETTVLSTQPRPVGEGVSVRAVGVAERAGGSRWSLSLIGADAVDSLSFVAGGQTFEPGAVSVPDEPGPVEVALSQTAFRALATTPDAAMMLNGTRHDWAKVLQADMQAIIREVE